MVALENLNDMLRQGQLMAALDLCKQSIRTSPSRIEPRVALYELSIFQGDWDRCKNQVETIMSLGGDPLHWLEHMANIHAAIARDACWSGRMQPPVIGECDADERAMFDSLWQAAVKAAAGDTSLTEENAIAYGGLLFGPGKVNDTKFTTLSTIDSRLPGILEVSDSGDYAWLWLGAVSRIEMQGGAKNLSEVMWVPARVFFTNGEVKLVNIFGLYPATAQSTNPMAVLGRATEWDDAHPLLSLGKGGQLFDVDDQPLAFQQIRLIEFEAADDWSAQEPESLA